MKPVVFQWTGDTMAPLGRFHNLVNDQYVIGEQYRLAEVDDRSMKSHNHYFACVKEAWLNLPEIIALQHPTPEHLRKFVLIQCGYADERSIVCASKAEARRLAAFIKPMDEYAVVIFRECVVKVFTAQSQSVKAMGNKVFQKSKTEVLDYLDSIVGAGRGSISANAGRAA